MSKYKYDNKYFLECIEYELFEFIFCLKIYEVFLLFDICEIDKKCNDF